MKKNSNRQANWQMNQQRLKQWNRTQLNIIRTHSRWENEPPVSQTEAGYQKIRAELHEARKNIPPKNPVDVGKQLAAARGEYVEGISDPDDPKWVHNNYSASNQGEKEEVVPEEKQPAAEPEGCHQKRGRDFRCISAIPAPPQTRPKKRKPEQKEMEKRRKRATSRKRLAIQDRKLQRTVDQVQLHSAKPHASGAY
ncbi:RecE-like protein [Salmonella enterica subsp. enterica]|nr:RecE-like protein [Salmonella enterica subsp. enterica]